MNETPASPAPAGGQTFPLPAEARRLLELLGRSPLGERQVFLRELLANAASALARLEYERLAGRSPAEAGDEPAIRILPNPQERTLTIADNGAGMAAEELQLRLGALVSPGARALLAADRQGQAGLPGQIGRCALGFYAAFLAAEWVRVVSRPGRPQAQAAAWFSTGEETYTLAPAEMPGRGTQVVIRLKGEATEFLEEERLRRAIRRHAYYLPFPIYVGESALPANRRSPLWRETPRQVEPGEYAEFYRQLTLDPEPPLAWAHLAADAPVQAYALLFIPAAPGRSPFSPRREPGLRRYLGQALAQEYDRDLLPEYLSFVQGVVDSEDLPAEASPQGRQAGMAAARLRRLLAGKVLDSLARLARQDAPAYRRFWEACAAFLKQGVAGEAEEPAGLYPLLRFRTQLQPEGWRSLDEYVERLRPGQPAIYYLLAEDERLARRSPHLEAVRRRGYEVLLLADPLDAFVLARLKEYRGLPLASVAAADLQLPDEGAEEGGGEAPPAPEAPLAGLLARMRAQLGERVTEVRAGRRLLDSPARLVDAPGSPEPGLQRLYRLMDRQSPAPQKALEVNPAHPILARLAALPAESPLAALVIEQLYENALLAEGLHPDPAGMIPRLQQLMESALQGGGAAEGA